MKGRTNYFTLGLTIAAVLVGGYVVWNLLLPAEADEASAPGFVLA